MRKIVLMAVAALAMGSVQAQAADYGLGVSVQSNDSIIYAPIDFNDKVRVEPNVRYRKDTIDNVGGDTKNRRLEVGTGVFALSPVNKSIRLYYGGRVSYIDQRSTQFTLIQNFILIGGVTASRVTLDSNGFRIAPTIGFEYLFNDRISIGGEAEYFYQDIHGDIDTKSNGTDTRLILRFRF